MVSSETFAEKDQRKTEMIVWSVFAGSRSPLNRIKIISQLRKLPLNTNQLANRLDLDYKIVEGHMKILKKNNLILRVGYRYGTIYFLSPLINSNLDIFDEMVTKLDLGK